MRKNRFLYLTLIFIFTFSIFEISASANSSWHWVTTSPMTIFPFVVLLTLFLETLAIKKFGGVSNVKKVLIIVSIANLLSFLAPYIERAYRFIPTSGFSISAAFNKGPYYIVLAGYLWLTIIIELPVTYFLLYKDTQKKRKLAVTIVSANILTTLLVAVIERLLCIGSW